MKNKEHTALIILNYNNYEDTINCIQSVEQYNTASIKYIVVDNGSTRHEAVEMLSNFLAGSFGDRFMRVDERTGTSSDVLPYVTFLVSANNSGYARGNNKGLKLANEDSSIHRIMILNNDVLFVEDIIPELIAEQETLTNCAIISPVLYKRNMLDFDYTCARLCPTEWDLIFNTFHLAFNNFRHGRKLEYKNWLLLSNPNLQLEEKIEVELPSGSCMLIKKDLFIEIGLFDPHTFLYYEENILFKKLSVKGYKNYVIPRLKCIHLGAESTKKTPGALIQSVGADSREYYLNSYGQLNILQKILALSAIYMYRLKIKMVKLIKKH